MMKSYLLAIVLSMILLTVLNRFLSEKNKCENKIKWQHYLFGYIFMFYLVVSLKDIVGFPALSDMEGKIIAGGSIFQPVLNLIPFSTGIHISSILNIICFVPFGLLLPTLWQRFRKFLPTVFLGFLFSLIIEVGQLFTIRATDVDDLIMNTLGTILGFILFKILSIIFKKLSSKTIIESTNKKYSLTKYGPYLYITIAVISTFLS